jgi:hypothetical protein
MGKITAYYSPVGPTSSGDSATGTIIYHITLAYTDNNGNSSYISAGPTIPDSSLNLSISDKAKEMNLAAGDVLTNAESKWGTLQVNGQGSFTPGDTSQGIDVVPRINPSTGNININAGTPYFKDVVSNNATLTEWNTIKQTYSDIASLHLTYSPYTQNSNSVACTALAKAGLSIPDTGLFTLTPACDVRLPTAPSELQNYLKSLQPKENKWYQLSQTTDSTGAFNYLVDFYNPQNPDYVTKERQGRVEVVFTKLVDSSVANVLEDTTITGDHVAILLSNPSINIEVDGSYNNLFSEFDGANIDMYGDYNTAYVDNSEIDFLGANNTLYGNGDFGDGWYYGSEYGDDIYGFGAGNEAFGAEQGWSDQSEPSSTPEYDVPPGAADWLIIGDSGGGGWDSGGGGWDYGGDGEYNGRALDSTASQKFSAPDSAKLTEAMASFNSTTLNPSFVKQIHEMLWTTLATSNQ